MAERQEPPPLTIRWSMRFASFAAQKRYGALILAGIVLSAPFSGTRAAETNAFVIPAAGEDGYGINECLHSGSLCGRVIADAWCESHGHARALAFGSAVDVTGSVPGAEPVTTVSDDDVVIRCGE